MATPSALRKSRIAKRDEFRKERLEVVVSSAESALKSAFLVNGGGAVALLAFFGQATRQGATSPWLSHALLALVIGTALATVATGLSFLAQYGYMMGKRRSRFGRSAKDITAANIVLVMLSYVCFVAAGFLAYKGFP